MSNYSDSDSFIAGTQIIPTSKHHKQNYCHDYYDFVDQGILQTYLHQVILHTNQSYFFQFGVDGATDWTMVNEDELAVNISVISDQELTMFFTLLFYDITFESNLNFRMQADNPSVLTVVEIDRQQEREIVINNSNETTVLSLTSHNMGIKCTSSNHGTDHSCGKRNMTNTMQSSNKLLLKKVWFQPRDPGSYAYNNEWSRNKYTWSGTKHMVIGETIICPFIGKCYQCKKHI